MSVDTLTTLDKLVKDQYFPGLQNWINKRRPLMSRLEKIRPEEWQGGRQMIMAVQVSDAQSTGAIAENEILPDPQGPGIQNMTLAIKYHYGTARMSAQAIHSATSDAGGFARAVKTVLDSVKNQLADDLWVNSTFGDGYGALGEVASYASTTINFKDQPIVGTLGTQLLRPNMYLSSYSAKTGGSLGADYKQITAKTQTTATTAAAAGFNTNDYVFRGVNAGVDPRDKVVMGLAGICDDGTNRNVFQGLSRSAFPSLKANVLANGGVLRAWTPELMDLAAMQAWGSGGGGYPTAIYSQLAIQQRAASYLRADRLYEGRMMELDGGYSGVRWTFPGGRCEWFADPATKPNEIFFVNEDDLFLATWMDVEEAAEDGRMWRYVDRRDSPECWLRWWGNIGARQCNNHTVLRDISHTA